MLKPGGRDADPWERMTPPLDHRSTPPSFLKGIFALVLAIALLGTAMLPLAAPATSLPAVSAESEAESAQEDFEEEEWEIEIEEEEDEEEGFGVGGTAGPAALPPECVLRTADPSVVAAPTHNRLLLTLRYTSETPTEVGVEYWLKGGKGTLQLDYTKRHLGTRGVLRMSHRLDERQLAKVQAARIALLRLELPKVDPNCKPFLIFRLATKQRQGSRTTFSQPRERRY